MIQHKYGNRFSMGEPDGTVTERLQLISGLLHEGGMKAPQKSRLQDESWIKLWGNCSYNPVSAFTGASLDLIGANEACRDVIRRIMLACKTVGEEI
jgi:2-dehydropantoate 2-reductase